MWLWLPWAGVLAMVGILVLLVRMAHRSRP